MQMAPDSSPGAPLSFENRQQGGSIESDELPSRPRDL
jgi:hypothetical protein